MTPPTMVTIHLVYITDSFNEMFSINFCTYVQQLLCTCVTVCVCVNCEGESVKGYTLITQLSWKLLYIRLIEREGL